MYQDTLHGRHSLIEAPLCTTIRGGPESFFYLTGCGAGAFFIPRLFLGRCVLLHHCQVLLSHTVLLLDIDDYCYQRTKDVHIHTRNKGTAISQDLNGHRIDCSR